MKSFIKSILIAATVAVFGPAMAQQKAQDSSTPAPNTPARAVADEADMTDGEVRKIDKEMGKLTLRHGEIKNLEMPPMTMVFQVTDPSLLDKIKTGDKVRFRAEKSVGGFVVTAVEAANPR
jgi:Cu(I)/Ag(I) efflux system protein CusF